MNSQMWATSFGRYNTHQQVPSDNGDYTECGDKSQVQ